MWLSDGIEAKWEVRRSGINVWEKERGYGEETHEDRGKEKVW
jgi:hypothetical protein